MENIKLEGFYTSVPHMASATVQPQYVNAGFNSNPVLSGSQPVAKSITASTQAVNGSNLVVDVPCINGRKCSVCNQVFQRRADLQAHTERVHHGAVVKPYKCQTCGKSFANASYLAQHERIHLGVKPYHCQICNRYFTQLSHQQQHMRTHTGERPYACRHAGCSKSFSQLSNLQSHMRSHMADRPFRCHSCYKCFVDEAALHAHIPHHNETKHLKTKICTVCGKSYAQETYLVRHMARHQMGENSGSSAVYESFVGNGMAASHHLVGAPVASRADNVGGLNLPVYRLLGDGQHPHPLQSFQTTVPGLSPLPSFFNLAQASQEQHMQ